MLAKWQVKLGEKVHGPFSDDQLRQLLRTGRIDFDTPVCLHESSIWRKAGEFTNLPTFNSSNVTSTKVQAAIDEVLLDRSKPISCEWHVLDEERVLGPYSTEDVQRLIATGKLTADHLLRQEGKESWKSADHFPELFPPSSASIATKPCPFCAEPIQRAAVKCKHCGEFLDGRKTPTAPVSREVVRIVERPTPSWNPGLAAVLSFLFPGLGQIYKGQLGTGIACLFLTILGYACFIVPGIILHIWSIRDAYSAKPKS